MRVLALAGLSILGLSCTHTGTAPSSEPISEFRVDRFWWAGEAPGGTTVRVLNPHGDVRIRSSDTSEVQGSAMLQRLVGDREELYVEVDEHEHGVGIEVLHPSGEREGRADVTILAPPDVPVDARTGFGDIKVKKVYSDVRARSVSGNLSFIGPRAVDASTEQGEISLTLLEAASPHRLSLQTIDGDVTIFAPRDVQIRLEIETGGEISSDFAADSIRRNQHGRTELRTTLGDGLALLSVASRTGNVHIEAL